MTYHPSDTPAAQLDRYIADVEERPRRRVRPGRWWHFAPLALPTVGAPAAWILGSRSHAEGVVGRPA